MLNDAELHTVFDRAAGEPPHSADAAGALRRAQAVRRRRALTALAASLAVLAGGAGAAVSLAGSSPAGPAVLSPAAAGPSTGAAPAATRQSFTVPSGLNLQQSLPLVAASTGLSLSDLQAAAASPRELGLPTWANGVHSAEGFLLPGRYLVPRGASAVDVLRAMVTRFDSETRRLGLVDRASALGLTPLQTLTVASIAQREATVSSDVGPIVRVILNRLRNPAYFPTLGMDSTARYASGNQNGPLTLPQLQNPSPYNTRVSPGVPPGPIASPSAATLAAALQPPAGDWLYFIRLPAENKTYFTASTDEFNDLSARCYRDGGCG